MEEYDEANGMCPNCVTPWKCNGPHEEPRATCCEVHANMSPSELEDWDLEDPDDQGLEPPAPSAEETLVDIALLALSRLSELLEGRTSR